MGLNHIDLRTTYKSIHAGGFNPESHVVSELYWSFLRNYSTPSVQQITIFISDDWNNSLTTPKNVKGFKEAFVDFDFKMYFSLDKFKKKRMQLEAINEGMVHIAKQEGWDTNSLQDAYNNCLERDLEYQFNIGKPKSSPNRRCKIGLWCNWDIDIIEVYWILYDKSGNEIKREKFIEKYSLQGIFIYYVKWQWLDNNKVLFEETYRKKEKWEITPCPSGL
ncbi:hypothetical protein M2451_003476 [Dysgonomonas sp. PFB1-18]|uniref:hypothetical protein n=1 Tax=unclassified Dysgonomonas TaxID=2630389 RepID=UPI0024763570|nr:MULTISPECIES: hypothetical protein [unclassified Dysgonomonas]MDH6310605.1 hypothetical protein [Dysgonomonas sp. PF1-14]MDH6340456.1 hypothetical protein [Dysgonomonas sp. PF1-16]MDH6382136.1 hypothetical protein [Dysgonomonas sp. PFB1-18]MDH6399480.1 hypothetical protein [Dysgonomonas sp. PF1-23]